VSSASFDPVCEAPLSSTDPNNQTTTSTYDELCRHERTDGPLGSFAESLYQNIGAPGTQYVEIQGPSPNGSGVSWSRSYMDGLGRSYKRESRGPTVGQEILSGEATFNERGGVLTSTAPRYVGETAQVTAYEYDALDRLKKTTLPDLNTVTQSYGLRETYVTNPEGDVTGQARNETGLVRYVIEYLGTTPIVTSVTTNLANRTETTQDYHGNTWVTQVNSLGQATWVSDPDSGTETREYNSAGEMTAVTNLLGERTELGYDLLGRLTTKTTRQGTPSAETTMFVYDEPRTGYFNKGRRTSMLDAAGYRYDDYDNLGRPARIQRSLDAQVYQFTHTYNTAGLPSSTTYPDNQSISWTYDAVGNLVTETGTITASTYDAAGRLKTRNFTGNVVTTYNYSPARGWIESINTVKGTSTVHQNLVYTHYPDGMVQSVTSPKSMESWTYAYDDLNRLLTATNADTPSLNQSFSYNEIGNITSNSQIGSYAYPTPGTARPHAVTSAGTRTYQYNSIGQMTSRNGTVLQWNGDGKPSSIGNVAFTYDGLGERLKKTSGGQTTKYIGGDYEIAPNGTVTKYLAGGKKVGLVYFKHHRDHLGSIQAVTNSLGNEVRRQKHKPFGDQHNVTGSHLESKGWIGEREEETELAYLNARYYDPEIGRFTAPDPIVRMGQGLNRYSYSWNSPPNFSDPLGLDPNPRYSISVNVCGPGSTHPACTGNARPTEGAFFYYNGTSTALIMQAFGSDLGEERAREKQSEREMLAANGPNYNLPPGTPACAYTQSCVTVAGTGTGANAGTGGTGGTGGTTGDTEDGDSEIGSGVSMAGAGTIVITAGAADGPFPVVEVVTAAALATYSLQEQKIYLTYTLSNTLGQTYVGRASGWGTPESVMMGRFSSHHMRLLGYGSPKLDVYAYGSQGYFAIRGREQQLMDFYGGVGSPSLGNFIRGVSRLNPVGPIYHGNANLLFGELSSYTGW